VNDRIETYKVKIANYLNADPGNIFLHWKGRVSLYSILKSMNVGKGDEVILPGYTCVVVPNAIMYLGAKPVYVDIEKGSFNMDYNQIEGKITKKTKVIICQNTYGLSTDVEKIVKLAKKYKLYTIEDCTHGFGGSYNGKPNGSYCDAAFYSTQWNKPFSTGIGGFALITNPVLLDGMYEIKKQLIVPSFMDQLVLKVLLFTKRYILSDLLYWPMIYTYRWLSKKNLILGSSSGGEISGNLMPYDYLKGISMTQVNEGLSTLARFDELQDLRKKNSDKYTLLLKENKKIYVHEIWNKNHSFLKYTILVKNRENFIKLAEKNRISLGDWFTSPLHPARESDLVIWNYKMKNFPVAVEVAKCAVNLPTDTKYIDKTLDFVRNNLDEIY